MWKYVSNMKKYVALGPRRAKHRVKTGASRRIYLSPYINTLGLRALHPYRSLALEKF